MVFVGGQGDCPPPPNGRGKINFSTLFPPFLVNFSSIFIFIPPLLFTTNTTLGTQELQSSTQQRYEAPHSQGKRQQFADGIAKSQSLE